MPKPSIRYRYQFAFECPVCSTGIVQCNLSSDRRRDKILDAPREGDCPECDWRGRIDAEKAIYRIVEQQKNGKWTLLRILDSQGEWKSPLQA